MKLYVCWTTRTNLPLYGSHPCGRANDALREAGYDPEVIKCYGWRVLPDICNLTPGRKAVKKLTGSLTVPLLVTDDGDLVQGSGPIAEWAAEHPAGKAV